ncbi:B3 domain-containing transcription factor ABI3 isoform X1 [Mangifera indica]|uniref:B3 domain-containing transcription factor ABI3 isoform X1 n=1 Tax=Mangifera indica TaxID=29780 RepID=UPI001CF93014|nr:B3 domain-containing transcription factor ABI3 isoform X1 [Mangifera indica]XP_044502020.1 B3 domain-containing transcription factor ABI3 isoform X1 [Mangifera indica]
MKSLQLHAEDLHAVSKNETNLVGFEVLEEEQVLGAGEREIWLDRPQDDLLDIDDDSILYGDFPPLPNFPCMSSSSSSSSNPAAAKAIASSSSSSSATSSSSAASWAVLRSDVEEDVDKKNQTDDQNRSVDAPLTLSSTTSMEITQLTDCIDGSDCMDVMGNFGFMDLLDSNDLFDPSPLFHHDENPLEPFQQDDKPPREQPQLGHADFMMQSNNEDSREGGPSDDLAMVFLEWLKTNKETVSAEDLRRVKIKKATIESAAKRLGGGKEAMKQLLKLILEWVQTNHLQKRRMRESTSNIPYQQYQDPFQNPNPNPTSNPNLNCNPILHDQPSPCFAQSPWIGQPSYIHDPAAVVPGFPPMVGYMGDPFANGASNINSHSYPPHTDYRHMLDSAHSWPSSQFSMAAHYNSFPDNNLHPVPPHPLAFTGYGNQYTYPYVHGPGDQRLMRLGSSATKEARKKRMARQRRLSSHPRHHQHNNEQNQLTNQSAEQHATFGNDTCNPAAHGQTGNWVFWPSPAGGAPSATPMLPLDRSSMQPQNYQLQVASDRRQGWKPEKNLRFLLQKVLKQSDVGNLGRIVLPKKEAETHLPELEARDGISIAMEDIGTSRVWNMRYSFRFWPNNKSRMYLLENTGDFVRANGLQEGDFIVIYSDIKCGKYLIRGVKVRQPGPKSETKKPGKSQRNQHASSPAAAGNALSSSPIRQTVK